MIHLDTNFIIGGLRRGTREDVAISRWILSGEPLGVTAPAWAEFLCGPVAPYDARSAAKTLGAPLDFTAVDAELAADLFNLAGRRRGTIVDCMIAAMAIRRGAELATANVAHFGRFTPRGLRLRTA